MHFSSVITLAASLALSLAAPAPIPTAEIKSTVAAPEPTSITTTLKTALDDLLAHHGESHKLTTRGDWSSICKNSQTGGQVCQSVCSQLYGKSGKCEGSWFGLDKICVCS